MTLSVRHYLWEVCQRGGTQLGNIHRNNDVFNVTIKVTAFDGKAEEWEWNAQLMCNLSIDTAWEVSPTG